LKKKNTQKRAGGVTQGVGPEFKPQYRQNKQTKKDLKPKKSVMKLRLLV
jgi:hypothetical protein